ncbi:MAG: methyltransferase domain-containing protein [Phycisphaeraceae bacterium]|nr:methyltransferase domain-containing protein [Phycisphaeraceae bacterium]MCW5753394.1 methyltransferase domain-containing protein [Phycisphaeraceae bacterium]
MRSERAYLLGTDAQELERLGVQHRLWAESAHRLWEAARVGPGARVLDVGCGPGFASLDLAQLVGPTGALVGVDESAMYIDHLTRVAAERGIDHLRCVLADVHNLTDALHGFPPFDVAYMRWVLCFTRNPRSVIEGVAAHLKPGGRFIIQDYFNYLGCFTIAPRRPSMKPITDAITRSWAASGGDPDVMGHVPGWLRACGLEVRHLASTHRVARSSDQMWTWPTIFWKSFLPRLVQAGYLSEADRAAFDADWNAASNDPDAWICLPPVFETIAVKH